MHRKFSGPWSATMVDKIYHIILSYALLRPFLNCTVWYKLHIVLTGRYEKNVLDYLQC